MAIVDKFKKKLFVRIGISLGIILLFVVFIIILNSDINKRVSRISRYKTDLAMQTELTALVAHLKKDAINAEGKMQVLENILPTRDQLITFPKELEKIAKQYKIDFGFSFGNEIAGTDQEPGAVRFTMSLAGSFANLVLFLQELEAQEYFISLAAVDFNRRGADTFTLLTSGEVLIHS